MIQPDFSTLEPKKNILIKGAQLHNLKNLDVAIPRNKLVVITGLSGSGKSSLAFDTLYAEGQRRYVESLSSYELLSSRGCEEGQGYWIARPMSAAQLIQWIEERSARKDKI